MRVVFDTNVLISRLLLAQSVPALAVDRALKDMEIVVSEATIGELADVLALRPWRGIEILTPAESIEEFAG